MTGRRFSYLSSSFLTEKLAQHDQAHDFLDSLAKRVDDVDDALMKSTEHLLPTLSGRGETSRMTATELSQVLSSLHGIHTQQIELLKHSLGDNPQTPDNHQTPTGPKEDATTSGDTPYHWSLGMPLEKVVETDNETDRYSFSTVASIRSLSFSHTPGRNAISTPTTPSIDGLKLR